MAIASFFPSFLLFFSQRPSHVWRVLYKLKSISARPADGRGQNFRNIREHSKPSNEMLYCIVDDTPSASRTFHGISL
jgi:hypothetical protein